MDNALGVIEIRGLAGAIMVADVMVKTAAVNIINTEYVRGHGWVTIKIEGDVASVYAAIEAGKQISDTCGQYVSSKVIPRPVEDVKQIFCKRGKAKKESKEQKNTEIITKKIGAEENTEQTKEAEPVKKTDQVEKTASAPKAEQTKEAKPVKKTEQVEKATSAPKAEQTKKAEPVKKTDQVEKTASAPKAGQIKKTESIQKTEVFEEKQ